MINNTLTRENLIKLLRKYMIDVYANMSSRSTIEDYLKKELGLKVLSGQKRLVVMTGQNTVLKIAYDRDGLMDNMNEVISSNRLRELNAQGKIDDDKLQLFGLCDMIDNNPFIIEMQEGTNFNEDPEFIEWYKRMMGVNTNPSYDSDALWFPVYMAENVQNKEDFVDQQNILATWMVASDTTPTKEPRNETLVTRPNKNGVRSKRLFLIDMGSCFPIIQDAYGNDIRPKCPRCGQPLVYVPYALPGSIKASTTQDIVGKYGCTNSGCELYYQSNVDGSITQSILEDSKIFTLYQAEHMATVRYLRAVQCGYYMPTRKVNTRKELDAAFRQEYGVQQIDPVLLDAMWNNYITKACGDIIGRNQELETVAFTDYNGNLLDYTIYREKAAYKLQEVGETVDNIAMRCVGLLYLCVLVNNVAKIPTLLYDLMLCDQNTFINTVMDLGLPYDSSVLLYSEIMSNF